MGGGRIPLIPPIPPAWWGRGKGGIILSFENFRVIVNFFFFEFSKNGFLIGGWGVIFWVAWFVCMCGMFGYIDRKEKEKAGGRRGGGGLKMGGFGL